MQHLQLKSGVFATAGPFFCGKITTHLHDNLIAEQCHATIFITIGNLQILQH